jgi:hypothetical protein
MHHMPCIVHLRVPAALCLSFVESIMNRTYRHWPRISDDVSRDIDCLLILSQPSRGQPEFFETTGKPILVTYWEIVAAAAVCVTCSKVSQVYACA